MEVGQAPGIVQQHRFANGANDDLQAIFYVHVHFIVGAERWGLQLPGIVFCSFFHCFILDLHLHYSFKIHRLQPLDDQMHQSTRTFGFVGFVGLKFFQGEMANDGTPKQVAQAHVGADGIGYPIQAGLFGQLKINVFAPQYFT